MNAALYLGALTQLYLDAYAANPLNRQGERVPTLPLDDGLLAALAEASNDCIDALGFRAALLVIWNAEDAALAEWRREMVPA